MNNQDTPFHHGEIAIQQRLGVAERMARFGSKVIRDHMPEQHQTFYQQLPMAFVGYTDNEDNVWASVLTGEQGFISTPNDKALRIKAEPLAGDPLLSALAKSSTQSPLRLGMLGIELATRRRNRLSTQVHAYNNGELALDVVQTFGNCPQYIQTRALQPVERDINNRATIPFSALPDEVMDVIGNADTFFVASSTQRTNDDSPHPADGADVSHRGGRPGFVRIDDDRTLTIPDYLGNNHFNTLGNFIVNPSAGLLFIDFATGDVITMTGSAEVLWDDDTQAHFTGAQRLWRFTLKHGYILKSAMPFEFELDSWSPNTLMTGTWQEAATRVQQQQTQSTWHDWHISQIKPESPTITSFYLKPDDGVLPLFKPGQFITLKVVIDGTAHTRTYSVSSAPYDKFLRISVKRDGLVSNWLHDHGKTSMALAVKLPQGGFYLNDSNDKPAVLLSAGVGITPMVSMFRHIVNNRVRTRDSREVFMVNTFRQANDQAFFNEINQLASEHSDIAHAYWLLTDPEQHIKPGKDYSAKGRISKQVLQAILPLGRYAFYLCGPNQFMQDIYDCLIELGVADSDIHAEAFGPASLQRRIDTKAIEPGATPAAQEALVSFSASGVEQVWNQDDGDLLSFAESHGLTPEFGCRGGSCGSCKVRIKRGAVTHNANQQFPVSEEEALLCCAMPAQTENDETVRLELDI